MPHLWHQTWIYKDMIKGIILFIFTLNMAWSQCDGGLPEILADEVIQSVMIKPKQEINEKNYIVEDKKNKNAWYLTIRFGPTFNWYEKTDWSIDTENIKITAADVKFHQRNSMKFYEDALKPRKMFQDGKNPAQIVDEPSNVFYLEAEKENKFVVGLITTHNKIAMRSFHEIHQKGEENPNNHILVQGTINEKEINEFRNLPYLFQNIESTAQFYEMQVYAQKIIPIHYKKSEINLKLGAGAGIYAGTSYHTFRDPDSQKFIEKNHSFHIQGVNGSGKASLEYVFPKKRWTLQGDATYSLGKLTPKAFDGTSDFNTLENYRVGFTLGHKFKIK